MGEMEERMEDVKDAETTETAEQPEPQEQQQEQQPEKHDTDWKAEARKWESRAKELLGSQAEQAARAEDAEAKLVEANRAKEHAEAVVSVAASSGVPAEFLAFCSDKEQMESFGKLWASYHADGEPPHAWAKAPSKRLVSSGSTNLSNRDIFASLFD